MNKFSQLLTLKSERKLKYLEMEVTELRRKLAEAETKIVAAPINHHTASSSSVQSGDAGYTRMDNRLPFSYFTCATPFYQQRNMEKAPFSLDEDDEEEQDEQVNEDNEDDEDGNEDDEEDDEEEEEEEEEDDEEEDNSEEDIDEEEEEIPVNIKPAARAREATVESSSSFEIFLPNNEPVNKTADIADLGNASCTLQQMDNNLEADEIQEVVSGSSSGEATVPIC